MSQRGRAPFEGRMKYCVRCCIPETEEGTNFDELGICQACRSSEEKMHLDWVEREHELRRILEEAKANAGDNYDCIVPISGGKDSTFQLHVLTKVYGMKPLAVTFSHNWFSETGWYNLVNALETFNVDHIMFTPNRSLIGRIAKRSLIEIGDSCWHCHIGVGAFPLQVAVKFGIPLLVYGEPSAEGQGEGSYYHPIPYDREYFLKISARKTPEEMVGPGLTAKDLWPFRLPTAEECEAAGVKGIHLGTYIFWDDERQMEFVRDTYGWRETQMENTYKRYKSAECIMPGVHDFTLYLKRGFGRATFHANIDVRNGLLTREEGLELASRYDGERPEALDYFLKITGMSETEFYRVMESHRKAPLRGLEMPIRHKQAPNAERILPVAEQLIGRFRQHPPLHDDGDTAGAQATDESAVRSARQRPPRSFLELTIEDILDRYRAGDLRPQDIAGITIDRVRRLDHQYHAWVTLDPEKLLEDSRVAEERIRAGGPLRALEGIPVGIKDVMNTIDLPTQMGSPLWKGYRPKNDARVVFNVKRAGGLVAGKTDTAEFAVHTPGECVNPHDPARTPGTSSSGSAVAVALGMVPMALGTQTAGSIVRPASFCGVYGCKPSFGLIPRTGVLKTTDSLDTVGFFVGHLADMERAWEALRVHGSDYPIAHAALEDPGRQRKPADRPWRVAFVRTHTWEHAEPYAREAILRWIERLSERKDVEVVEPQLPRSMARAHEVHATIYVRALANYFQKEFESAELVSPTMNDLIRQGLRVSPEDYRQALREQEELARDMDDFMARFDAMVSLSTAGEAPPRTIVESPDPALMWTMTWLPVISAPAFTSPRGLPFGVQLVARRYNDRLLFRLAEFLHGLGLIPPSTNPALRVDP